jgi:PKD repeat protein
MNNAVPSERQVRRLVRGGARWLVVALIATGLALVASTPATAATPSAALPTENPANWTPNVLDGEVQSIWQVGNRVIIGGNFTQVANSTSNGGAVYPRRYLAAFDATTGVVDTNFAPVLDGLVNVVLSTGDGTSVYVGGDFNTVNGTNRRKLARINLANGALVTSFNMQGANGLVRDLKLVGGNLYVSGLFTTMGGLPRTFIGSVDPTTGRVNAKLNLALSGLKNGGVGKVIKMDATPAGDKLLIIGNFTTIAGQSRVQVAMLDLTTTPVTLSPWSTTFYTSNCSNSFDSYLRDVDIAPDGSYAVIVTTGAYGGATSACDSIARFETTSVGGLTPTWTSLTGGDTSYSAEIHNGVVYVGGHMRWVNNPYSADRHGAGGVARTGMGALDPQTGIPFNWNPTRTRGVGLYDYHVTDQGLWAGSDTDRWNNEERMKLAFFPWAGGVTVPTWDTGRLPNDVYLLGRSAGTTGTDPSVLYRVNAGGPQLAAADDGPVWAADTSSTSTLRNSGSNTATAPSSLATPHNDATVPRGDFDRPPRELFTTERWDPTDGGNVEMAWNFPVPVGTPIQVRLYFANRATSTDDLGERIFDVDLDGQNVLNDLDLSGQVGHDIGTMRSFDRLSDGTVNILFRHQGRDNPLINGIEIIRTDLPIAGGLGQQDEVQSRNFTGSGAPGPTTLLPGTAPWRTVRAAFIANGTLFTGHGDGTWMRRTFSGGTFGPGASVDMWSNDIGVDMNTMTAAFFDAETRRVYYTLSGNSTLYWRWFNPESAIFGAQRYATGGAVAPLNPSRVRGMFISESQLYFVDSAAGALYRMGFAGGVPSGTPTLVDSTSDWRARALFMSDGAQPNVPPVAAFTSSCTLNVCAFDGAGSSDSDGSVASYAWDFGDGETGTGSAPEHTYRSGGTFTVTLSVTDDRVGSGSISQDITVADPPNVGPSAAASASCTLLDCAFDGGTSFDPDGDVVSYEWDFGDGQSGSGPVPTHSYAVGGTYDVTLTVTDDDGESATAAVRVESIEPAAAALFRASASANSSGATASVVVPASVEQGDQLLLFITANLNTTISTPAGWTLLGTRQDGSPDLTSWVFTRTAAATTAGSTVSGTLGTSGKSARLLVAYTNAAPPTAAASSVMASSTTTLTTPAASVAYTGAAVVSAWADKSGGNTGWTLPTEVASRAVSLGTGTGQVTAATGDTNAPAGSWPGATATSAITGSKGVGWTIIVPPATGNFAPTAAFTPTCTLLSCSFDGSASADSDGTVTAYDWDFGDGTGGTGPSPEHEYAADGTYQVTLTVTDDDGATAVATAPVSVSVTSVDFRAAVNANTTTANASLVVPNTVQSGDQLLLFVTANVATTASTPAGWVLLDTQQDGSPDTRSWVFTRTADANTASTTVTSTLGVSAKVSRQLLAYRGAAPITTVASSVMGANTTSLTTPSIVAGVAGSRVVSFWSDKTTDNLGWTIPAQLNARGQSIGSGSGHITTSVADLGVTAGPVDGLTATSGIAGSKGVGWSVVVSPA